ncbi:MAG: 1-acyl-sn-glycerol-3-phosphate acyltransferase [Alphaproteobacteria bacterium]
MPDYFIRSTIFNLCFYALTAISCICLLPTLILPRTTYLGVVYGFVHTTAFLEKYILGLTYEIRGKENLPTEGAYIIAAKHQSAYETFKLHILFKDPSIVLKKELLKIPLWGKYLEKSDVIAIDRSSPKLAIKSLQDGAKHVTAQNRPIIIFPQGTRVSINTTAKEKPYKIGLMRIQEATNLPIIPMALNTGYFQPKHKWCKKPGRVVFEFLKPIPANSDKDASATLKVIEMKTEEATAKLLEEAKTNAKKPKLATYILWIIIAAALIWSANWFVAAHLVQKSVTNFLDELKSNPILTSHAITEPTLTGFPFKIRLDFPPQKLSTERENIQINSISAQSPPFMGMPINIKTGEITLGMAHWKQELLFESLNAEIIFKNDILMVSNSRLNAGETYASIHGTTDFNNKYPDINFDLTLVKFEPFLALLVINRIVKEKPALFAGIALTAIEKDGAVNTTITNQDNKIYLGPIKVLELPKTHTE